MDKGKNVLKKLLGEEKRNERAECVCGIVTLEGNCG